MAYIQKEATHLTDGKRKITNFSAKNFNQKRAKVVKQIIFSEHAVIKPQILKRHGFKIQDKDVINVIKYPDKVLEERRRESLHKKLIMKNIIDILIVTNQLPKTCKERGNLKAKIEGEAELPLYHPFEIHLTTEEAKTTQYTAQQQ